jgi:hypothetical protein
MKENDVSKSRERAKERELKRLPARETERNHLTRTVFLSNQNKNGMMTSRCLLCRHTGNKNAKRIIYIKTHNKSRRPLRGGLRRSQSDDGRGKRRASGSSGEHDYFCSEGVGVKCALE